MKAWELIDKAGCRGLSLGGAQVSTLHCNFLINLGSATAADLEALGEEVRRRVLETSGVALEWEIKRIGARPGARDQNAISVMAFSQSNDLSGVCVISVRILRLPVQHCCLE